MGLSAVALVILLTQWSPASAHDFWIERKNQDLAVVFGHGSHREEFDVSKVKDVKAIDLQGKEMAVRKEKRSTGLAIRTEGQPAALMVEIDNGYWSKTIYGWKELPKRKATRVVEAIRSFFFSKAILAWNEAVQQASSGSRIDIVPLTNPFDMKEGDLLTLRVRHNGKLLQGAEVIGSDHARIGSTDKEGVIRVPLVKGLNLVAVEYKERVTNDPDADALSLTGTLTFEVGR